MDISYAQEHCSAVLQCWYSGGLGGRALAEILFGRVNPSGRLPVTFYYDGGLPEFTDYSMKGRTYRYLKEKPLYPFGYGLSYSRVYYSELQLENMEYDADHELKGHIVLTNDSDRDTEEVVQVYLDRHPPGKAG